MKLKTLVILALCTASSAFAVNKKPIRDPFAPKDMVLVPAATVNLPLSGNIAFSSFYLGKEVTNKEFREFLADMKSNPEQTLRRKILRKDPISGAFKDSMLVVKYGDVAEGFKYDSDLPFKDYATDVKYDKYPVVAVSQTYAGYYAMWKTRVEGIKNSGRTGLYNGMPFMAASPAMQEYIETKGLKQVSKERKLINELGVFKGFELFKGVPMVIKKKL